MTQKRENHHLRKKSQTMKCRDLTGLTFNQEQGSKRRIYVYGVTMRRGYSLPSTRASAPISTGNRQATDKLFKSEAGPAKAVIRVQRANGRTTVVLLEANLKSIMIPRGFCLAKEQADGRITKLSCSKVGQLLLGYIQFRRRGSNMNSRFILGTRFKCLFKFID